jgi:hypothetical protein
MDRVRPAATFLGLDQKSHHIARSQVSFIGLGVHQNRIGFAIYREHHRSPGAMNVVENLLVFRFKSVTDRISSDGFSDINLPPY